MTINKEWVEKQLRIFNSNFKKLKLINNFLTKEFIDLFPNPNIDKIEFLLYCINTFWRTFCSDKEIEQYAQIIYNMRDQFYHNVYIKPNIKIIDDILSQAQSTTDAKYNVSLISKFCCKCNEKHFPITDSKVREFLCNQNKEEKFYKKQKINPEILRKDYVLFVEVLDCLIKNCNLDEYKYRKLDLAIWTYMKTI